MILSYSLLSGTFAWKQSPFLKELLFLQRHHVIRIFSSSQSHCVSQLARRVAFWSPGSWAQLQEPRCRGPDPLRHLELCDIGQFDFG